MVVVLPTPFTPTNNHTFGSSAASRCNERSVVANCAVMPSRKALMRSSALRMSPLFTEARSGSSKRVVRPMPMSALRRVSSRSSHVSCVMPERPRILANALANTPRDFAVRSRTSTTSATSSTLDKASSTRSSSSSAASMPAPTPSDVASSNSSEAGPASAASPETTGDGSVAETFEPEVKVSVTEAGAEVVSDETCEGVALFEVLRRASTTTVGRPTATRTPRMMRRVGVDDASMISLQQCCWRARR